MQGQLPDGTKIAVKQLSSKSRQGNREFLNEIGMISCLQHPNLVKLHGFCVEGDQLLLVYEYMENNSLARALFGECCIMHSCFFFFSFLLCNYYRSRHDSLMFMLHMDKTKSGETYFLGIICRSRTQSARARLGYKA